MSDKKLSKVNSVTQVLSEVDPPNNKDSNASSHPLDSANMASKWSFWYMWPLVRLGYKRPLQISDLNQTPQRQQLRHLFQRFQVNTVMDDFETDNDFTFSVNNTLWKMFKTKILLSSFYLILSTVILIGNVFIFRYLLQSYFYANESDSISIYLALFLAIMIGISYLVRFIVASNMFRLSESMGIQARTVLMSLIFRKAIRIPTHVRSELSSGEIVNIMSNDAERLSLMSKFLPSFFGCLPSLLISTIIMCFVIGWPGLIALLIMATFVPFSIKLGKNVAKSTRKAFSFADQRVKFLSEMLNGVRVLKMYAWEEPLAQNIQNLRKQELEQFRNVFIRRGIIFGTVGMQTHIGVVCVLFTMYLNGTKIDVEAVYTIYQFIIAIRFALLLIPYSFNSFMDGYVALSRMQKFFNVKDHTDWILISNELKMEMKSQTKTKLTRKVNSTSASEENSLLENNENIEKKNDSNEENNNNNDNSGNTNDKLIINMKSCDFQHDPMNSANMLKNVTLEIEKGELVAVIGNVGSGKSTLLLSILGETFYKPKKDGIFEVNIGKNDNNLGEIGYVGQNHFVMNATIKENILFNNEFDENKYEKCINASALRQDIELLATGDETEIGEKGINLSGGQKARLCLARSLYRIPSLLLLDDPLSAVDNDVAKVIFFDGIKDLASDITRIVVLNSHLEFLEHFDRIIIMEQSVSTGDSNDANGKENECYIVENCYINNDSTKLNELKLKYSGLLQHLRQQHASSASENDNEESVKTLTKGTPQLLPVLEPNNDSIRKDIDINAASSSMTSTFTTTAPMTQDLEAATAVEDDINNEKKWQNISRMERFATERMVFDKDAANKNTMSEFRDAIINEDKATDNDVAITIDEKENGTSVNIAEMQKKKRDDIGDKKFEKMARITREENRVQGKIGNSALIEYFNSASNGKGIILMIFIVFLYIVTQFIWVCVDLTLSFWGTSNESDTSGIPSFVADFDNWDWIVCAFVTVFLALIGAVIRGIIVFHLCVGASYKFQNTILNAVLGAPISYFDATATGVIVNRFSRDLQIVDNLIPLQLVECLQHITQLSMNLILMIIFIPWYLLVLVPMCIVFYYFRKISVPASRDLKRIEGVTRSPIYNVFSEVISGLETIRAYRMKKYFIKKLEKQIELNDRAFGENIRLQRWFGFILESFVFFQTVCICVLCVLLKNELTPAIASLCITYATLFGGQFQWMTRLTVEIETLLTAVERLHYFSTIEQEKDRYTNDNEMIEKLKSWPNKGEIELKNLKLKYRSDLPLILKNVSCEIKGGEKIGICGRTGAGKSSIMVALYRLFEPETESQIIIDNVNVMEIGLFDLRSNLAIIPQSPVLFSGTLRFNLDPFSKYSDDEIWSVLKRVELFNYFDNNKDKDNDKNEKGLNYNVAENGSNFSQGQKQLICIARALLRSPKILLLDEATSSVDTEMDAFIQASIRQNFKDCTVLTIAHRLDTIIDSDKIMVLDNGNIVEFDSPKKLLENENGIFAKLWNAKDTYQ